MQRSLLLIALTTLVVSGGAAADEITAERVAIAQKVVAATPDGAQHWTVLPNGVVRHNNSGLACGAEIADMPLVELKALPGSPVTDGSVDCRYSNPDNTAGYDVYAFSPGKALSGEDAFAAHRAALMAGPGNPAPIKTFSVADLPETRGEVFLITASGKRRFTYLCVGVVREWVVSVRFTAVALTDDLSPAMLERFADALSVFPQGVTYRALRGVAAKQLGMPDPKDGF